MYCIQHPYYFMIELFCIFCNQIAIIIYLLVIIFLIRDRDIYKGFDL